jgi:hypothetical protein
MAAFRSTWTALAVRPCGFAWVVARGMTDSALLAEKKTSIFPVGFP